MTRNRCIACWNKKRFHCIYQRDLDGIPRGWLQLVKESIRTIAPQFCTKRMVKDYVETMYLPAMSRTPSTW